MFWFWFSLVFSLLSFFSIYIYIKYTLHHCCCVKGHNSTSQPPPTSTSRKENETWRDSENRKKSDEYNVQKFNSNSHAQSSTSPPPFVHRVRNEIKTFRVEKSKKIRLMERRMWSEKKGKKNERRKWTKMEMSADGKSTLTALNDIRAGCSGLMFACILNPGWLSICEYSQKNTSNRERERDWQARDKRTFENLYKKRICEPMTLWTGKSPGVWESCVLCHTRIERNVMTFPNWKCQISCPKLIQRYTRCVCWPHTTFHPWRGS